MPWVFPEARCVVYTGNSTVAGHRRAAAKSGAGAAGWGLGGQTREKLGVGTPEAHERTRLDSELAGSPLRALTWPAVALPLPVL